MKLNTFHFYLDLFYKIKFSTKYCMSDNKFFHLEV